MKQKDAAKTMGVLAQENRLDVFRMLAAAGPEGLSAGHVAAALAIAPIALTFHLDLASVYGAG